MKIQKVFMMLMASILVILMANVVSAKPAIISIASGGTGGTYYPMAAAIAELISDNIKGIKNATAQVTGASFENVRLLQKNACQLAITNSTSVYEGYHAIKPFKHKLDKIRTICWGHGSIFHIVAKASSGIKTIMDIKGKRFSVGSPGSGNELNVRRLLETNGLSYKDFRIEFLSFAETINALKDGRIDAGLICSGVPVASIMDLAIVSKIVLVPIPDKWAENLISKYPFFDNFVIPAGSYKGVDKDIHTVISTTTFACTIDLPADIVYQVIKLVDKKLPWMKENVHKDFVRWRVDPSVKRMAPLHPGAIKYYKEIGKE